MSISGIEAVPGLSGLFPGAQPTAGVTGPTGPTGPNFADLVTNGIEGLEAMNDKTDRLAVGAATGDLGAIHDYTIAATETSVATQLTVAVRNKAVEAFNEIMRMQV
jgi:flagellar hook-basal body complex protein FliE